MSVRLYLVRHGEAASSWGNIPDPGLSDIGRAQATDAAEEIEKFTGPIDIVTSPLLRAQETAMPLEEKWGRKANIFSAVSEIPSNHIAFEQRKKWLGEVMAGNWSLQSSILRDWRDGILEMIKCREEDTVIFSHFMVINSIVGYIAGSEKMVNFRPDNGSITQISSENGQLKLIEQGREAITVVE
ncbi:MAG: histidine phosphatase family protein [Sneathiella sp.]